uniref:Chromosome 16 open reading frame 86 n=1 Tax=Loxodonta africana TaxID=9785 RepID=G3TLR2_LOXAF
MASAGAERRYGPQDGTTTGLALLAEAPGDLVQSSECPVTGDQCLVPALETCQTQGEDKCRTEPASEPVLQEERLKPAVEAIEETGPRPLASIVRPSHGLKRKAEAELPLGLLLQKGEPEGSEPSPSSKQHKKPKKRKSLGAPALPATVSTVSASSETLGLEPWCSSPALSWVFSGKAQRLRPLYQYINYCNPELNQAGEGGREAEAEVEPQSELALVPMEAGVEQLQALPPVAGELGLDLAFPCPKMLVPPTHILDPLAEEAGEEPGGLPSLGVSSRLTAEVDKSNQVDINKMLSVCAAPLVPPLSPQYK